MRLILRGKINSLYVQSLCMIFFRGEKFPEYEESPRGIATVALTEKENGAFCRCIVAYDGKEERSEAFEAFSSDETRERTEKTAVGRAIFDSCVRLTGYRPVWGLLTGIRPSSVAMELVDKLGEKGAFDVLVAKYLLADEKARLAIDVAKNESLILSKYGTDTCSVYISVPFCPTRCSYCSFISYATKKLFQQIPEYVSKLVEDIKSTFKVIKEAGLKVATVYIGGGTPTTLSENQLDLVLSTVNNCLNGEALAEFTVECGRPDTITQGKLEVLKRHGVDRVSVNPQTLNDSVLEKIGRKHTVNDFYVAFDQVKGSEFKFVNTDLIAGLDGDDFDSFKSTVDKIIELNPDNVTVHTFSVKKSASVLSDDSDIYTREGEFAVKSVDYAYKALTSNGYFPYYMYRQKNTVCDLENVGYAKGDYFGIYNVLMMGDGHTVFGIGAGATTKLIRNLDGKKEILRIFCPKYPYEYLQNNKNNNDRILEFLKGS